MSTFLEVIIVKRQKRRGKSNFVRQSTWEKLLKVYFNYFMDGDVAFFFETYLQSWHQREFGYDSNESTAPLSHLWHVYWSSNSQIYCSIFRLVLFSLWYFSLLDSVSFLYTRDDLNGNNLSFHNREIWYIQFVFAISGFLQRVKNRASKRNVVSTKGKF